MPALILKPLVMAAVDMQHHARQRAPFPALAMHATLRLPLHQARSLEGLLHPGVAQPDLVLSPFVTFDLADAVPFHKPQELENQFRCQIFACDRRSSRFSWTPYILSGPRNIRIVSILLR